MVRSSLDSFLYHAALLGGAALEHVKAKFSHGIWEGDFLLISEPETARNAHLNFRPPEFRDETIQIQLTDGEYRAVPETLSLHLTTLLTGRLLHPPDDAA